MIWLTGIAIYILLALLIFAFMCAVRENSGQPLRESDVRAMAWQALAWLPLLLWALVTSLFVRGGDK